MQEQTDTIVEASEPQTAQGPCGGAGFCASHGGRRHTRSVASRTARPTTTNAADGNGDITITDGAGRVLRVLTPRQAVAAAAAAARRSGRKKVAPATVFGRERQLRAYLTELGLRDAEQAARG